MTAERKSWIAEIGAAIAFAGIFGCSLIAFAHAAEPAGAPRFPIPATVLSVTDGDTIKADLLLPWDVTLRGQDIRENSYDAWESSKRRSSAAAGDISDAEVLKGKLAATALKDLLGSGEVFLEPSRNSKEFGARDVYGRLLGKLWVARGGRWIDVGHEMKRNGHDRRGL